MVYLRQAGCEKEEVELQSDIPCQVVVQGETHNGSTWESINVSYKKCHYLMKRGKWRPADSGPLTKKRGWFTMSSYLWGVFLLQLHPCSNLRGVMTAKNWGMAWGRRLPPPISYYKSESPVYATLFYTGRELRIKYEIEVFKWRASKSVWKLMKLDWNITREPEIQWE